MAVIEDRAIRLGSINWAAPVKVSFSDGTCSRAAMYIPNFNEPGYRAVCYTMGWPTEKIVTDLFDDFTGRVRCVPGKRNSGTGLSVRNKS